MGVCMYGFCNVWFCVFVGFVMCGCFDNCVGVLVISVLVLTAFFIFCTVFFCCFVYMYSYLLLVLFLSILVLVYFKSRKILSSCCEPQVLIGLHIIELRTNSQLWLLVCCTSLSGKPVWSYLQEVTDEVKYHLRELHECKVRG